MTKILIFPGQGAQAVGMGAELYKNSESARCVFDAVDDALGEKLTDLMFEGDLSELTRAENAQPAIFACGIAAMFARDLRAGADFGFCAGHSLGEITALCAAGAIDIGDCARLLRYRGKLQVAAPAGAMAAIMGMTPDQIAEICRTAESQTGKIIDPANDNAPGQFVVLGESDAVAVAVDIAKSQGARAIMLNVSGAFHSRLMSDAAQKLSEYLKGVKLNELSVPIISNMTAAPMTDVEQIRESLSYQMTHGVRFRESVLNMPNLGITSVIDAGPGNVITGLVKKTLPDMEIESLVVSS